MGNQSAVESEFESATKVEVKRVNSLLEETVDERQPDAEAQLRDKLERSRDELLRRRAEALGNSVFSILFRNKQTKEIDEKIHAVRLKLLDLAGKAAEYFAEEQLKLLKSNTEATVGADNRRQVRRALIDELRDLRRAIRQSAEFCKETEADPELPEKHKSRLLAETDKNIDIFYNQLTGLQKRLATL